MANATPGHGDIKVASMYQHLRTEVQTACCRLDSIVNNAARNGCVAAASTLSQSFLSSMAKPEFNRRYNTNPRWRQLPVRRFDKSVPDRHVTNKEVDVE